MRERSKWERETVSNTPDRGFSSSTAPSWGGFSAPKSGTYAVATLIVAWSGLTSNPPRAEPRRGGWFTRDSRDRDDDRGVEFSVVNRCEGKVVMLLVSVHACTVVGRCPCNSFLAEDVTDSYHKIRVTERLPVPEHFATSFT